MTAITQKRLSHGATGKAGVFDSGSDSGDEGVKYTNHSVILIPNNESTNLIHIGDQSAEKQDSHRRDNKKKRAQRNAGDLGHSPKSGMTQHFKE